MKKRGLLFIAFFQLLSCTYKPLWSQEIFLTETDLTKELWKTDNWQFQATVNWKHIYDEIGWSRIGLSPVLSRLEGGWRFSGGIVSSFTFDSEIDNFWELRPWVAVNFNFLLLKTIRVGQRFRSEWREFVSAGSTRRANYHRFRYALNLGFRLWDDPRWSQRLHFEQYFLDSPADNERFPTERDYNLTFFYQLANEHQLSVGFEVESYFFSELGNTGHAYLLILGYRL